MVSTIAQPMKGRCCIPSHENQFQSIMIRNFASIRGISEFNPAGFSIPGSGAARVHHSRPHIAGSCLRSQISPRIIPIANSRKKEKEFGPWDQDDEEVEDDGKIYVAFKTIQEFRYHCRKKCVIQLFEHRAPDAGCGLEGAFGYADSEYLAQESILDPWFHDPVRDVINRYNFEQKENLELIKILHTNYLLFLYYMKIEARDNNNGDIRTYHLAIWNKDCNDHPVVGRFKEVNRQTSVK